MDSKKLRDSLIAFADRASECSALALQFVGYFGPHDWSKDRWAAEQQASVLWDQSVMLKAHTDAAIQRYNSLPNIALLLDCIKDASVANLEAISVDDTSWATAHEAALAQAQSVTHEWGLADGFDARQRCDYLAGRLRKLGLSDLQGQIEVESRKAIASLSRVPVYVGGGKVDCGDESITLTFAEGNVLQLLVERRSCSKDDLEESGHTNAPKYLSRIRKKYPELEPHIIMPGVKGQGGYRTTIIDGRH